MSPRPILPILAVVLALAAGNHASAQLFGNRSFGNSLSGRGRGSFGRSSFRRPSIGPGSIEEAGSLDLGARYIRGNRSATDFVGTDSGDLGGFVGMQQADSGGQVRSAVTNLRIESGPDANRTQSSSQRGPMYRPRLRVDFEVAGRPADQVSSNLIRRLESSLALADSSWIEVSLVGRKAILRGEVASERDQKLARLLLLLEPGISDVQNDLAVKPPSATPDQRPPTQPDRQPPKTPAPPPRQTGEPTGNPPAQPDR